MTQLQSITELRTETSYVGRAHIAGRKWRLSNGDEGWKVSIAGGSSDYSRSYWVCHCHFSSVQSDLFYNMTAENRYTIGPVIENMDDEDRGLILQQIAAWEESEKV